MLTEFCYFIYVNDIPIMDELKLYYWNLGAIMESCYHEGNSLIPFTLLEFSYAILIEFCYVKRIPLT